MSPTQRSLKWLRDRGGTAQVVEKWNPYAKVRQDLFGIIDIVCVGLKPQDGGKSSILGVQTTTGSNMDARIKKALQNESLCVWLDSGGGFEVHGWRKAGSRGEPKKWALRRVVLGLNNAGGVKVEDHPL